MRIARRSESRICRPSALLVLYEKDAWGWGREKRMGKGKGKGRKGKEVNGQGER